MACVRIPLGGAARRADGMGPTLLTDGGVGVPSLIAAVKMDLAFREGLEGDIRNSVVFFSLNFSPHFVPFLCPRFPSLPFSLAGKGMDGVDPSVLCTEGYPE